MRTTIALALLALASTASAQNNRLTLGAVALLPGHQNSADVLDGGRTVGGSEPGAGVFVRFERMVGVWGIGMQYEYHRQIEKYNSRTALHLPALWTRFRGGSERVGGYFGIQLGGVRGDHQSFFEGIRGFHTGAFFGIEARGSHVGFLLEAGYQFTRVKSESYTGYEDHGATHTPIIRLALTAAFGRRSTPEFQEPYPWLAE